jgi:MoaA/NifB/PqqE/SkfB family radical SAM enzyme
MKVRHSKNTFIRQIGNETLLWHRHTFAATVLKDATLFLSAISQEWQEVGQIVQSIADSYQMSSKEVLSDLMEIIVPLIADGLLETDDANSQSHRSHTEYSHTAESAAEKAQNDRNILSDFYIRHHVPCDLHIDLTSACTERCVHCYIPEHKTFLPFEEIDKALNEFHSMGGMTVYLSGGECMLHPDFERVLRRCVELDLNCIILTNLTMCDEKMVRFLAEANPHFVKVSLYSMIPSHHDAITQVSGSWQRTMDAFLACEHAGIRLELAAPVLKQNQNDFADLATFAKEHNVYLVVNSDIIAKCNHDASNLEHALSPEEFECFLEKHAELLNRSYDGDFHVDADAPLCDIGSMRICLNSQGDYYPCDGCHGLVLGNVGEQTLQEVWDGAPLNRLRALKQADIPRCLNCQNRRYCKICMAENFSATGDVLKVPHTMCEYAEVKRRYYGKKQQCC